MSNIKHAEVEKLFWYVYDDASDALVQWNQNTIPESKKLAAIMAVLRDLALAMAGGFRPDGERQ
jgi:hypothetical protein